MKIMIVDDSMMVRRIIEKFADKLKLEVVGQAANGREAVENFEKFRPELVTLDMTMPEMDGLTAMQKILAIDPKAKIIIASAVNNSDTIVQALNSGAKAYLVKPFDEAKMIATFTKVMEN